MKQHLMPYLRQIDKWADAKVNANRCFTRFPRNVRRFGYWTRVMVKCKKRSDRLRRHIPEGEMVEFGQRLRQMVKDIQAGVAPGQ